MLDKLNLTEPVALIIAIIMVVFILYEVIDGYKKGFLESGIRLIGYILLFVGSYVLKNPLSVFLYTHLPFFKFGGLYNGISALNILVYELIAFIIVFVILLVVFKIILGITKIADKLLSLIFFIGIPNKILGAILGFVEGVVLLYFIVAVFKIGSGVMGFEMKESAVDLVVEIPILKETFGPTINSLEKIAGMAKDFEHTKDKDEFNKKAFDILLEYDMITEENLELLIESGKVGSLDDIKDFND